MDNRTRLVNLSRATPWVLGLTGDRGHVGMRGDDLYVGVCGGHQRSTALALREDGRAVAAISSESLNLHTLAWPEVATRLEILLSTLLVHIRRRDGEEPPIRKLVLAMPGAASVADQEIVQECLSIISFVQPDDCIVLDDTWAGLIADSDSYYGVCAFAGTGASVFVGTGGPAGRPHKIDGWGPTLGDFGSGFQLATDMFRRMCRAIDRGEDPPLLAQLRKAYPSLHGVEDLQRWFDRLYVTWGSSWRTHFADAAKVAVMCAALTEPDEMAVSLVRSAARQMAQSIGIGLQRVGVCCSDIPVFFQGGMFVHSSTYREEVTERIRHWTSGRVAVARFRPVVGAAISAFPDTDTDSRVARREIMAKSLSRLPKAERLLVENVVNPSKDESK